MKNFSRCPRCGSLTQKSTAYNGGASEFWFECTRCNTYINSYIPQPHQAEVHRDAHTYIGNFGGYGTGKTLTSRQELYKHVFTTPNANVLIGANVSSQYEQTIKRDIEADIPKAFVKYVSTQKSYMDLINGARIMFRPLDDVDKIRSYNLTMFIIVEASEVDPEAFVQLKTRLRNLNASIPYTNPDGSVVYETLENGMKVPKVKTDWLKGIIESNPDSGWIRTEVLYTLMRSLSTVRSQMMSLYLMQLRILQSVHTLQVQIAMLSSHLTSLITCVRTNLPGGLTVIFSPASAMQRV